MPDLESMIIVRRTPSCDRELDRFSAQHRPPGAIVRPSNRDAGPSAGAMHGAMDRHDARQRFRPRARGAGAERGAEGIRPADAQVSAPDRQAHRSLRSEPRRSARRRTGGVPEGIPGAPEIPRRQRVLYLDVPDSDQYREESPGGAGAPAEGVRSRCDGTPSNSTASPI